MKKARVWTLTYAFYWNIGFGIGFDDEGFAMYVGLICVEFCLECKQAFKGLHYD